MLQKLEKIIKNTKKKFSNFEIKIYAVLTSMILLLKVLFLSKHLKETTLLTSDSVDYLSAGENFFRTYFSTSNPELVLSLYRLPGYPLLISITDSTQMLIWVQIFAHSLISIVAIILLKKIFNIESKLICLFTYVLIQIETSLLVYSFRLLSDLLFALIVLLLIYAVLYRKKNPNKKYLSYLVIFLLIACFLFRPTSFAFIIVFAIMSVISENKKYFMKLFVYSVIIFLSYSSFNFVKSGVFTYTLLQNQNFLIYEGIGSKDVNSPLEFNALIDEEIKLRNEKLGYDQQLIDINNYNLKRGLELINTNRLAFAEMHTIGILKVVYGPNRFELTEILSDGKRLNLSKIDIQIIYGVAFFITFFISSLGLISMCRIFAYNDSTKLISITIITFILISSSSIGYGRFRTPISALLIVCIAISFATIKIFNRESH
jgi:hypothetical protein